MIQKSSSALYRHLTARDRSSFHINIHSGISKSPLSLSTATRMTFIEEKFEVYQGKHYQSMGRSWSRNEFWYWSLLCIDVGMKIVYWTFKFSDSTEFLSDKKCLYNRYSVSLCENSGGNFLVPYHMAKRSLFTKNYPVVTWVKEWTTWENGFNNFSNTVKLHTEQLGRS